VKNTAFLVYIQHYLQSCLTGLSYFYMFENVNMSFQVAFQIWSFSWQSSSTNIIFFCWQRNSTWTFLNWLKTSDSYLLHSWQTVINRKVKHNLTCKTWEKN